MNIQHMVSTHQIPGMNKKAKEQVGRDVLVRGEWVTRRHDLLFPYRPQPGLPTYLLGSQVSVWCLPQGKNEGHEEVGLIPGSQVSWLLGLKSGET